MIVSLWSGPRNLSTALMYFFAHRGDFKVMDEPFFGAFLQTFELWRPSREMALATMEKDPAKVLEQISTTERSGPLFLKNMANHLPLIPKAIAAQWKAIILYRDPAAVIHSYRKQMKDISLFDLAYKEQAEWLDYLQAHNIDYYLLDSARVQQAPQIELAELCNYLRIPFDASMLQWPAGPIKEDGIWAQFWYQRVHQSCGIEARPLNDTIPDSIKMEALYQECLPHYTKLKKAHHEQIQYPRSAQ